MLSTNDFESLRPPEAASSPTLQGSRSSYSISQSTFMALESLKRTIRWLNSNQQALFRGTHT